MYSCQRLTAQLAVYTDLETFSSDSHMIKERYVKGDGKMWKIFVLCSTSLYTSAADFVYNFMSVESNIKCD